MTSPVAVLRPEPGNARTAARVEARGLHAIRLPLFAVVPLAWASPHPAFYDALLATSANAFRHDGDLAHLRSLPVWAVGPATATAARRAGFTVETVGDADAASLVARAGDRRLLHIAGRDHHPVAGADTRLVYAADPLPITTEAIAALYGSVALLHSSRAAARLAALVAPEQRPAIALAALSAAIAAAAGPGWAQVAIAAMPRDEMLVALAADLAASAGVDRAPPREDNRCR